MVESKIEQRNKKAMGCQIERDIKQKLVGIWGLIHVKVAY